MAHLRSFGYSYEKMVPFTKGYHYCYSKATNQMYLLDEDNNVVHPKNATVSLSDLWAAYGDHGTYMIDGITQYYAIKAVTSQVEFDSAFADGTNYVLDLNDNICTVNGKANVTVMNGFATGTGFTTSEGVTEVKASDENNTVTTKNDAGKITKVTYTNVLNPATVESTNTPTYADGSTVEYVNCVFTKHAGFFQNGQSLNLTFKNCSFVNINTFGVTLQPGSNIGKTSTVTFDGCEFVNCDRGININAWENTTVNITGCTFALKTGSKAYNCVQISSYANDEYLASMKLNFKDNTVASANGVVYFHDEMTGPQDLNSFKGVLNFSGNTYAEGVSKIADRGEYPSNHKLYQNTDAMKELEALIK